MYAIQFESGYKTQFRVRYLGNYIVIVKTPMIHLRIHIEEIDHRRKCIDF